MTVEWRQRCPPVMMGGGGYMAIAELYSGDEVVRRNVDPVLEMDIIMAFQRGPTPEAALAKLELQKPIAFNQAEREGLI